VVLMDGDVAGSLVVVVVVVVAVAVGNAWEVEASCLALMREQESGKEERRGEPYYCVVMMVEVVVVVEGVVGKGKVEGVVAEAVEVVDGTGKGSYC